MGVVSTVYTPAVVQTHRMGVLGAPPSLYEAAPAEISAVGTSHRILSRGNALFYMLHPSKQDGRKRILADESPHDSLLHPLKTGSHRDLQLQTLVDMRGLLTRLRRVDSRSRFSCDEKAPKSRKMFPARLRFFFPPLYFVSCCTSRSGSVCWWPPTSPENYPLLRPCTNST